MHFFSRRYPSEPNTRQRKTVRPPMRTLVEMAEEFGVTPSALTHAVHADPAGPRPSLRHHRHQAGSISNTWYDPGPLRRWWAARKTA